MNRFATGKPLSGGSRYTRLSVRNVVDTDPSHGHNTMTSCTCSVTTGGCWHSGRFWAVALQLLKGVNMLSRTNIGSSMVNRE